MINTYKICDIIDSYISGDWGNDCTTDDTPHPVYCVRGADIVPISNSQFNDIPLRYVSKRSFQTRCLQEGDIIIEKSGGTPHNLPVVWSMYQKNYSRQKRILSVPISAQHSE